MSSLSCHYCGTTSPGGSGYCGGCGAATAAVPPPSPLTKGRGTILALIVATLLTGVALVERAADPSSEGSRFGLMAFRPEEWGRELLMRGGWMTPTPTPRRSMPLFTSPGRGSAATPSAPSPGASLVCPRPTATASWVSEMRTSGRRMLTGYPLTLEQLELSNGVVFFHFAVGAPLTTLPRDADAALLQAMAEAARCTAERLRTDSAITEVWVVAQSRSPRSITYSHTFSRSQLLQYRGDWRELIRSTRETSTGR